jgi:hypothetical protein
MAVMGRRLIVCNAGTWQNLSKDYPTNVVKMAQAICRLDPMGLSRLFAMMKASTPSNLAVEEQALMR